MKRLISTVLLLSMLLSAVACTSEKAGGNGTTKAPEVTEEQDDGLNYDKTTYAELFKKPSNEYRWNAILHTLPKIVADNGVGSFMTNHVQNWLQNGQGGVVTNVAHTKEYLDSPTAFSDLNTAVKALLKKDVSIWLYDELGYPSGSAGGRTTLDHPEYVAKGLVAIYRNGSGVNPVTVTKDNDLLKFHSAYAIDGSGNKHNATVTDNSVSFAGVSGSWTLYVFAEKKLYEGTHAQTNGSGGNNWLQRDYLNIMDRNAVAEFINNTYKPYAEKFEYFDQVVGVFTDEPSLMESYIHTGGTVHKYAQLAWVDGLEEKFEEMHGYSITDNLHYIFADNSDKSKIIRVNFRQTVAELVSENYFGQIAEFCEANGSVLSGHGLLEETLSNHVQYYGDLMQSIRKMGIPGVDALAGDPSSYMNTGWPIFMAVKYVTSVATLKGDRHTMVEFCAPDIESNNMTDKQKDMIWTTLNLMYFHGINQINSYFALEYMGTQKRSVTDYFGRLSYISRSAKWDGQIGMYYPINTNQAYSIPSYTQNHNTTSTTNCISTLAVKLFQNQRDFTVVDNEFILEAEIKDGTLTNGKVSFTAICMPGVQVMPIEVLKKLQQFESSGGTVVWVNETPSLPDDLNDIDEFKSLTANLKSVSENKAVQTLSEATADKLDIKKTTSTLYVGRYVLEDAPMYWLFNYNDVKKDLTLTYEGATAFDIYDPLTGEITTVTGDSASVTVDPHRAKIVIVR